MPKFAAVLSSPLQSQWQRWGGYWAFLLVSIFLLVGEQSGGLRFLWDLGQVSTAPGVFATQQLQGLQSGLTQNIWWRQKVLVRLATVETERTQQDLRLAALTQQVESLSAVVSEASFSGKVDPESWTTSTWEGLPGAWQVRAGCLAGLQAGDPVITPEGILLGNVSNVLTTYSSVVSWDTPAWRTPARVGTSSAVALAESTVSEPMITGLRWPTDVAVGSIILTAGSGNTPRNLFIGTVESVEPQEAFGEVSGRIRIPVELHRLQKVLVPRRTGETCSLE